MATPSVTDSNTIFDYSAYAFLTGDQLVTELVLVRHAQPMPGRAGGAFSEVVDPPLSDLGERQAEAIALRMADEVLDAVYTSNLRRARQTGAPIAAQHGIDPVAIPDLREVELFRGIPADAKVEEFLDPLLLLGVRERMMCEKSWDVYPCSEPSRDFRKRVVNTIEGIAAAHDGQRVVIVCHGGVINAYLAHHLGIGYDMFFRPQHASINVVLAGHHGIRAPRTLGDTHHLRADQVTY